MSEKTVIVLSVISAVILVAMSLLLANGIENVLVLTLVITIFFLSLTFLGVFLGILISYHDFNDEYIVDTV